MHRRCTNGLTTVSAMRGMGTISLNGGSFSTVLICLHQSGRSRALQTAARSPLRVHMQRPTCAFFPTLSSDLPGVTLPWESRESHPYLDICHCKTSSAH